MEKGLPLNRIANVTVTLSARPRRGAILAQCSSWATQLLFRFLSGCAFTPALMISAMTLV
jgi:hypothetical protein